MNPEQILLVANSQNDQAEDAAYDIDGTPLSIIDPASTNWKVGMFLKTANAFDFTNLNNAYLYLAAGQAAGGSGGRYNAGKFMIKLYGVDPDDIS